MGKVSLPINYEKIRELGYDFENESLYKADHPQVVQWSKFFIERMEAKGIFQKLDAQMTPPSKSVAKTVCREWHRFSEFIPWFLCRAASMVSNNRLRHYVIQTAFEELGMRNSEEIHHELFLRSAISARVPSDLTEKCITENCLENLKKTLISSNSDEKILGLLLGLEIPARENISAIFNALSFDQTARSILEDSKFFQLHRQLELEHIRLNISIFLRFCKTEEGRRSYTEGFEKGLEFWGKFWTKVGSTCSVSMGGKIE